MKSKTLAISAISAALVAVSLTVGAYIGAADLFALIVASAFVIMPLYRGSYRGCLLAFAVGGVIALIASGFNFAYSVVFPAYFGFFGAYPILFSYLSDKNVKKPVRAIIGILWCVAAFYGMYFYYTLVMGLNLNDLPEWMPEFIKSAVVYSIGVIAVIFYFIFDRFIQVMRVFFNNYIGRITKDK
ncbi:MAG TPA: hypothetical protein DEV87_03260 [Clostridiales bacterium]|nr:hypothetical protein [Clostridiales bacterium]